MQKKTKYTIVGVGSVFILTVVFFILIKLTGKPGASMDKRKQESQGKTVVSVRSIIAEENILNDYVITNGEVQSQSSIEVFPSMSGKVAEINVLLGSAVRKGEIIARIDPSEPGTNYALSPVVAPVSGSIVSSPLKTGTKVSTSTAITEIGDIENLQISANIPERYVAELRPGLKAEISLEAYPGVIFNAFVTRVSPVVDASTRTKQVILNFEKKDTRINAGMFAKVKLFTSKYEGFVTVPSDAVIAQDDSSYLFVIDEEDKALRRFIKTGKTVDGIVQITEGLSKGERVICEGMLFLSDGAKVKDLSIQKTETESEMEKTNSSVENL